MTVAYNLAIIAIAIVGLWKGADWVVESASRIARRMGLSELVIGLTVVAIGTSAPEFAVTVNAALKGQAEIAIGNVVGSNIFNLGFILGGVTLFGVASITRRMLWRDGGMLIGTGLLLVLMLSDGTMRWWEGMILVSLLIAYLVFLFVQKEQLEEVPADGRFHWWDVPMIILGIGVIVTSGHFLVESASVLARLAGISEWFIAVTIVAIGTSMPEFATSFVAVIRGRHGISLGNLIGSDLFNLLGVLGLSAMLQPLQVTHQIWMNVVVLAVFMFVVVGMMRSGWKISRTEGIILLLLTAVRWGLSM